MTAYKCAHGHWKIIPTGNGDRYVCIDCGAVGVGPIEKIEWFFEPVIHPEESSGYLRNTESDDEGKFFGYMKEPEEDTT